MTNTQTQAWLDQEDARIAAYIRKFGWAIEYVFGDRDRRRPSLAYTVGLFGMGHPELMLLGLPQALTGKVLNDVGERIRAGADLIVGQLLTFDWWPHQVLVEAVPNPGEIVFSVNRHYQRPSEASAPVLQLTYDDAFGCFPWDDGFRNERWRQPRPGDFRA